MTRVVHFRKESSDVYIGRSSIFGNPFTVAEHGRREAMRLFRLYFWKRIGQDEEFRKAVEGLRGKTLACWCKDKPSTECHGDVYVEYLEGHGRLFQ